MTRVNTQIETRGEQTPSGRVAMIAGRPVGFRCKPYVIAEAGVNHNGDASAALRMIDAAHDAGADAVKFQVFTATSLTTQSAPTAAYQAKLTRQTVQRDMLAKLELSAESLRRISERCRERGIAFLGTPFSCGDVSRLVQVGTVAVKIASTDVIDVELIEAACRTGLPVILSTGAAEEAEIAGAVAILERCGALDRLILLHCVSAYPTPLGDSNLARIATLAKRFNVITGYSDHTTSTLTGALAVAAGACVLEKHFTLDRSADGPDHAMSLKPPELVEYVRLVRQAAEAMGDGSASYQAIECDVRRAARKNIVAARDISGGVVIERAMLTFKRAGSGLSPNCADDLVGRRLKTAVAVDTPLEWEMIE